jgi:hypothetical protein
MFYRRAKTMTAAPSVAPGMGTRLRRKAMLPRKVPRPVRKSVRRILSATMQTTKQYRHNAEVCLKLASETTEIYAQIALIDLATEFRGLAEDLERLPRAVR